MSFFRYFSACAHVPLSAVGTDGVHSILEGDCTIVYVFQSDHTHGNIPVSFGSLHKIGRTGAFFFFRLPVGGVLRRLNAQHHSWDRSLATPMITSTDPPVDYARARGTVQEEAVVFVPPAPAACGTCTYPNMQVRIWWWWWWW